MGSVQAPDGGCGERLGREVPDNQGGHTVRKCIEHDDLGCPMTRINRVNGQGPTPCPIMLIGEAPGKTEDKQGIPFCGKSGSELTYLYLDKCANISRQNVYVTNLVKCRTNDRDRDPSQAEENACSHLLVDELLKVKPRFVGLIGRLSSRWLLHDVKMEKMHGFGYEYDFYPWGVHIGIMKVMPLYHPAYGLHNTAMMRHIMEDFTRFGRLVRGDTNVMWKERKE